MDRRCICGLIALLAIHGCSHGGHSIVGTWTADAQNHIATENITYNADGTFTEQLYMSDSHLPAPIDLKTKGTWKEVSEDHYQKLITDVDMSKMSPPPGMDAVEAAKAAEEVKPSFIKSLNQNTGFTTAWNGNDTYTVTNAYHLTKTFHRKA